MRGHNLLIFKFCFAGAYYHKYKERSQVFDRFAEKMIQGKGLDIYDRNYGHARPEHAFPWKYNPYILGNLPADQIDRAYKGYFYGVNLNSIQQSQSMFARRVFELLACNTVIIGNFSRGVKNYFGDLTICTDDETTEDMYFNRFCKDPVIRDKYRLLGLRKVLSEGLYQDRLGYITEKVFGINMKPALPKVTILAYAHSRQQAIRLEKMFQEQTIPNAELVFLGEYSGNKKYTYIAKDEQKKMTCRDLCCDGLFAWWEGTDWYGPNYLLDLVLTWNYGNFRGAGKTAYFLGEDARLTDIETAYRPASSLKLRRSVFSLEALDGKRLFELSGETSITGERLMGTDAFQYCQEWSRESCPAAEDLRLADQGLPLHKILSCAEEIKIPEERGDILRIPGSRLSQNRPSAKIPVTYSANGPALVIESSLPEGRHEYIYHRDLKIETASWLTEGKLPVQFRGAGSLDLVCAVICYDKQGKRLDPLYPKLNRRELLTLPKGTESVELAFRPKGPGKAVVKDVIIGGETELIDHTCFLARSDVLVLTNHYPSYDALYRNMFVHKRVTSYRESGKICDVMRMYPYSKDGYREFEGINVTEGKGGELMRILDSGEIRTVCVHFLDREMWEVLKNYLHKIRLLIWAHGADIQPWWRREFDKQSERETDPYKKQSEECMKLWKEVFSEASRNDRIHFIYVSHTFAREVMEDYKIQLKPFQYSIIHNFIDTELFRYTKKDKEQRRHILTIKPFSGRKYANDLTTKGILELSKRPCFKNIEIDIYGDGPDFDKDTGRLRKFSNVHLHRGFIRQEEIAVKHKNHGVYIAATRSDTQGVSRDEAMSSGLVPIAHDCTAVPEFMDDSCGILIPAESYVELADAMERLYKDVDLFQRLSENAAKRVRSQSSKEFTIDREIALIENVRKP